MIENLVWCALAAKPGPFAPDLDNAISEPDALEKVRVLRAYLAMLRCEVPPDDLQAQTMVVEVLEAVPDRWLHHSATRRFVRNQLAKSFRAPFSASPEWMERYAAVCLRMYPRGLSRC